MLRAAFGSVSDPLQPHVCFSCLARRFGAPTSLRQFHVQPALRAGAGDGEPADKVGEAPKPNTSGDSSNGNPSKNEKSPSKPARKSGRKRAPSPSSLKKSKGPGPRRTARKATKRASKPQLHLENASDTLKKVKSKAGTKSSEANSVQSLQEVTKMLKERTQKAQDGGVEAPPKSKPSARFIGDKHTGSVNSTDSQVTAVDAPLAPVPRLSFGLDRVLFNPGVYQLRDPRSRVYNFDPYLGQIMPVTEFDFNALKEYITSSKDETLRDIAAKGKKKYAGSSSSMTSVLSHFHYLLSAWRPIDARTVSQGFPEKLRSFTRLLRAPAAMFLHYQDGVYAIDADKEFDSANILMNLGKSMEKLLTLPKEDFERYRRTHENKISAEEEKAIPESYHFSTYGDFIMRSQLDAHDPRLPGTGMFDLKTRAVVSIRMDARNFEHGLGYEIKGRFGLFESYEREFYDMIRAAFLKYSLQVRIGRMDGIFVAFHNVERIFGFQYISLPEMDQALHGQSDTALGDTEFQLSLGIWNKILDQATEKFPKQSLRFHFETRDAASPFMYIFAEPVTQEDIDSIQTKNKAEVEAYQQRLLNLTPKEDDSDLDSDVQSPSDSDTASPSEGEEDQPQEEEGGGGDKPLLAMVLTIRNKVNGNYVERPTNFTSKDNWTVEYELSELSPAQGRTLYRMCQVRRSKELRGRGEDELDVAGNVYIRRLRQISKQGRDYRARENAVDQERGIVVWGDSQ